MEQFVTTLKGVATELLASALLLIIVLLRNWIKDRLLKPTFGRLFKRRHPDPEDDMTTGRRISDAIAELKGRIDADRVMVIQFHNGETFAANNPIWKMSCTHETASEGVSYEASNFHAIPISQMVTELSALWDSTWREWERQGTRPPSGIKKYQCGGRCQPCAIEMKIVETTTHKLAPSYMKATLSSKGTVLALSSPLVVGNNIVGFVGVDYTNVHPDMKRGQFFEVCEAAKKISFYISQGVH